MAFEEYDDFEQEKLVKDWIKSNWLTIATGIVLGLGSVIGINYWKTQKQEQRFQVANQYNSFTEVMELSELDEAQNILKDIETSAGDNFYTYEAHFLLAKEYAQKDELDKAAQELSKVIENKPDQILTEFARLRLARVYNAMNKPDDALSQISKISIESFSSIAKEIKGDAYLAKGENDKANTAYQEAIADGEGYSGKTTIEMKLENS